MEEKQKEPQSIQEAMEQLEKAGIDTSKVKLGVQHDGPIRRHSAIDVYRNNKLVLQHLKRCYLKKDYDTIYEYFETKDQKEAEAIFEKSVGQLPFGRYTKLRKLFYYIKDCFDEGVSENKSES